MICPKCGKDIGEEKSCPDCGIIEETTKTETTPEPVVEEIKEETPVEQVQPEEPKPTEVTKEKKEKTKKKFPFVKIIICLVILAAISGTLVFFLKPRISLKIESQYELEDFLKQTFEVKGSLTVKLDETTWKLNGYKIHVGKKIENLPVVPGKNKLVIANGELEKTYTFKIKNNGTIVNSSEGMYLPEAELDYDGDGITNAQEKELGLSIVANDTDDDGLLDNVELVMGLDPKKKDDYDKTRTYEVKRDNKSYTNAYVEVTGKGNVANTFLDTTELNMGFAEGFVQSDFVVLSTSNHEKPESMKIYFQKDYKMEEETSVIYDYNPRTNEIKPLETKYEKSYFTADIDVFNHIYFVGNSTKMNTEAYKNQIMILIDNSGSMFTPDYVKEKTGYEIKEADYKDYNNDVDFKRLDLMNSLIDALGTEDYEYTVNAFTGDYCDLIQSSKDKDELKNKIESLRTECQNFNGTKLSDSILKYYKTFDYTSPGIKYMIVLTDGNDSEGLFGATHLYSYDYNNIKNRGVRIITIGLGQGVDGNYLQEIAAGTNGKYLYASDANMLEELINLIKNSIKAQEVEEIDGKEVTLIADSGFDVKRDAFNFENFGSKDSPGGNCYGFAYLSKQIYLNTFPSSAKFDKQTDLLEEDDDLVEYELTEKNKERLKKGNVYGIKIDSGLYSDVADEKVDLFKDEIEDSLLDDYQVLQMINRAFRVQKGHIVNLISQRINHKTKGGDYQGDLMAIFAELNQGSPALLSLLTSIGGHSVLGTKLYRSNDYNEYILYIYDSNFPGEDMKATLTRQIPYEQYVGYTTYSFEYTYPSGLAFTSLVYAGKY